MTIIGERNTFDDQTLLGGLLSSTDDDRDLSKYSGQSDSLFELSPLPLNSLSSHNIQPSYKPVSHLSTQQQFVQEIFKNNLHLRNISGTHINYAFTIHPSTKLLLSPSTSTAWLTIDHLSCHKSFILFDRQASQASVESCNMYVQSPISPKTVRVSLSSWS